MKIPSVSALCVFLFTAFTSCRDVPPVPEPLSPRAIEEHIAFLADDALEGRDAGTPGCHVAERYIANRLERAGLDAVEEQAFDFVAGSELLEGSSLAVGAKKLKVDQFRPLAYSKPGEGTGDAVYVGYGITAPDLEHDDYGELSVKKRLVVILAGSPDGDDPHGEFAKYASARAKALRAVEKGAVAMVVLVTPDAHGTESLPAFREDISSNVDIPVIAVKASAIAPLLGIDIGADQERLARHERVSRRLGRAIRYDVRIQIERRTTHNILGWLVARSPEVRDEVVIVGAHHDHLGRGISGSRVPRRQGEIHNGADDNASGVAAILELARHLAPRAASLKRHVLFMTFAGEERGLLGSKHFKKHPLLRLPAEIADGAERPLRPVAMINLDMVGRLEDSQLLATGLATGESWRDLLDTVRGRGHGSLKIRGDDEKDILGSSDHTTFYEMGLPVVFFFTGSHEEYHTPEDDLYRIGEDGERERLINLEGMTRATEYISDVLVELAQREENIVHVPGKKLTRSMNFRVVLRLMPDYAGDLDGMGVSSVTAGGPAAKAGIQAGDIIVKFGSTPVRSVEDYMVGLNQAKPGEALPVEVLRDGEKHTFTVEPQGLAPP